MLWPDASLEQALARVPNAPLFRRGQEETLIGREFSYSSARLGGSDVQPSAFPTKSLWFAPRVNRVVEVFNRDGACDDEQASGVRAHWAIGPIGAISSKGTGPS